MERKRHIKQSSVPDFLEQSPFLPVGEVSDDFRSSKTAQKKQTIRQQLGDRQTRQIMVGIMVAIISTYFVAKTYSYINLAWFSGPRCLQKPVVMPPVSYPGTEDFDWSHVAYTQYVTNTDYLCNSLMSFEALHRLGSKADRLMLYPSSFNTSGDNLESQLLNKAKKEYGVHLVPIEVQRNARSYHVWAESFTKLLAFNQTQYKRILMLDSDSTLLRHMDELFFIPPAPIALPRAYWLDKPYLSSQVMLIEPSALAFERVKKEIQTAEYGIYDMDIVNDLYWDDCVVIPHRKYNLLTGEFRNKDHTKYLGKEKWDPVVVIQEAKFIHFSDYPVAKPWLLPDWRDVERAQPDCGVDKKGEEDCQARYIWLDLYEDFKERRKSVCGLDLGEDPHH